MIIHGGHISGRPGVHIPADRLRINTPTPYDLQILDAFVDEGVDMVAISFVRSAHDVRRLGTEPHPRGPLVVAKVETRSAVENLPGIIDASGAVMIARGDLGIEYAMEEVPHLQKMITRECIARGRPAITATQMLESMHLRPEPTRAEVADVANAILDGTSVVMLSGETAQGSYPVESVRAMADIARVAEREVRPLDLAGLTLTDAEAVLQAAAVLGDGRGCACYITPTQTGGSPRALARQRPRAPIVALCHDEVAVRQLALEWGVVSRWYAPPDSISALVDDALAVCVELLALPPGAPVVMTHGQNIAMPESTSLIVLRHVPDRSTVVTGGPEAT